uniref:Uncharacterized protein n=1 Tax=Rhizophora mucronata TaxID=61149 RepID=A0A2P2NJF3_RHIMU
MYQKSLYVRQYTTNNFVESFHNPEFIRKKIQKRDLSSR